jgi:hypothetical protein
MKDEKARQFVADFIALCKKYNLAISPAMGFEPDFHDGMLVSPLDDSFLKYYKRIHILSEIESDDEEDPQDNDDWIDKLQTDLNQTHWASEDEMLEWGMAPFDDVDLSPEALKSLTEAGWKPEEERNLDDIREAFKAEKVPLHGAALDFLSCFGGIIARYDTTTNCEDVLEFCAADAVKGMGRAGQLEYLAENIGLPDDVTLCPIGHFQYSMCMLLMTSEGKVYAAGDEGYWIIGNTPREAINNVIAGNYIKIKDF